LAEKKMSVEKKKKNSDFFSVQLFLGGASSGTAAIFTHPIGISLKRNSFKI
jgi:hypothetical protein